MAEKYIQKKSNYFYLNKSRNFGKFKHMDEAIYARDLLLKRNWDIDEIQDHIFELNSKYYYLKVIDDKIHIFGDFESVPDDKSIEKIIKNYLRNPNNTKYGLNISRIEDVFVIRKQIFGDEYIFGVFNNLKDAQFIRNFLLENQWDVNALSQVEYDDETDTYKIVEVIDDKAYVLGSFESQKIANENIDNARKEFIGSVYKHKYALSNLPHLNDLTDRIDELKTIFNVDYEDGVWSFDNAEKQEDALNKIIFNLTPWQKIIYDNMGDDPIFIDELMSKIKTYKSKNFKSKVEKYLKELIDLGIVEELQDKSYVKV